jgi:hypothetical protein
MTSAPTTNSTFVLSSIAQTLLYELPITPPAFFTLRFPDLSIPQKGGNAKNDMLHFHPFTGKMIYDMIKSEIRS